MTADKRKGAGKLTGKNRIVFAVVVTVMGAIAACTLFVYVCSFLPVKKFELVGITQYEKSEIIELSGIKDGDRLYSVDTKKAEEKLLGSCFYLEEVHIERKFPDKIVISVTERVPEWYIEVSGSYYSMDGSFMVMEETISEERFKNMGMAKLVLPNVRSVMLGELPSFGADELEISKALELVYEIQRSSLKSRITLVDMESRFDVNITVDDKYHVYLGDISNISDKLVAVEKILDTDKAKECDAAEIDASIPEAISLRPIYSQE